MIKPYIGITGATTEEEIDFVSEEFQNAGFYLHSDHQPMIGFLVSSKTMNNIPITDPIYASRYPKIEDLEKLLTLAKERGLFTTVHYNTKQPETLAQQINQLMEKCSEKGLCDTVQLNVVWPLLSEIKQIPAKVKLIFQANSKAMSGITADEFGEKLKPYLEYIHYVLLDPSGGLGKECDIRALAPFYDKIIKLCPAIQIGFAGGFSGENIEEKIIELITATKRKSFSIDAEGKLRTSDNSKLDREKVRAYLQGARALIQP